VEYTEQVDHTEYIECTESVEHIAGRGARSGVIIA
jgi:hypothetical protein